MKKTPLYQWHVDNDANMAEFGSYLMPLWYPAGTKNEHIGVIESAGLFDTSHMAVALVQGDGAHRLLQRAFTKDLDRCQGPEKKALADGRCVYGAFLNDKAHVIDDAIVYKRADRHYMVVVNANMGGVIASHLGGLPDAKDVDIIDLSDKLGKIDIQGPASAKILSKVLRDPERAFASMVYFSFKGWFDQSEAPPILLRDGTPILLSRTGYTGEFGFEIFVDPQNLAKLWGELVEQGGDSIVPCGLAARDSLRAGAVLPLSHQDIGDWPFLGNPWGFALPYGDKGMDGKFTKSFIGSEALMGMTVDEFTYPFAGFDPRKIVPGSGTRVVDTNGDALGKILTCTTDMAIGRIDDRIVSLATTREDGKPEGFKPRGLCCGFVKVSGELSQGNRVFLSDGRRKIEVEIRDDVRPDRSARRPIKQMI